MRLSLVPTLLRTQLRRMRNRAIRDVGTSGVRGRPLRKQCWTRTTSLKRICGIRFVHRPCHRSRIARSGQLDSSLRGRTVDRPLGRSGTAEFGWPEASQSTRELPTTSCPGDSSRAKCIRARYDRRKHHVREFTTWRRTIAESGLKVKSTSSSYKVNVLPGVGS